MKCIVKKPNLSEYAPGFENYMDLLPDDGYILQYLKNNLDTVKMLITPLPEEKLHYRYAAEKWNIKEVLVHITDDERIYAYRTLRFARNDHTALPGYESDNYARYSGANERNISAILEEYAAVRSATIALFKGLSNEAWDRAGISNGS